VHCSLCRPARPSAHRRHPPGRGVPAPAAWPALLHACPALPPGDGTGGRGGRVGPGHRAAAGGAATGAGVLVVSGRAWQTWICRTAVMHSNVYKTNTAALPLRHSPLPTAQALGPLSPLLLQLSTTQPWASLLAVLLSLLTTYLAFIAMPLLDLLLGQDLRNPTEVPCWRPAGALLAAPPHPTRPALRSPAPPADRNTAAQPESAARHPPNLPRCRRRRPWRMPRMPCTAECCTCTAPSTSACSSACATC
jgi:hypothetical protein